MTKLVGITGGIGSGKTTLSNHLKKLGYLVHESDVVVSEMYNKPKKQFLSFVKEKISEDAVNHNKINKTEIANVIFNNKGIKKLLEILHTFVALGNTVVVIEHNLDVIKTADYIVDMGPEGGVKGGKIIAEGKPEEICKNNGSYTGKFLKPLLN